MLPEDALDPEPVGELSLGRMLEVEAALERRLDLG
jgi:hypothetical protein